MSENTPDTPAPLRKGQVLEHQVIDEEGEVRTIRVQIEKVGRRVRRPEK